MLIACVSLITSASMPAVPVFPIPNTKSSLLAMLSINVSSVVPGSFLIHV